MRSKCISRKWMAAAFGVFSLIHGLCTLTGAGELIQHRVEKGDTLWSISERYFGDPNLWPRLWEMNPFVTNPHLLKAGDLVRIGVREPVAIHLPEPAPQQPAVTGQAVLKEPDGIQVGAITNLNARGLFSEDEQKPLSVVQASDSQKLLLSKGDYLFLNFAGRPGVKAGDSFMVFRPLDRVRHVLTGDETGYLYSARARLILRERSVRDIYRAEILENYGDVNLGDLVLPFVPLPSCMLPLPSDPGLRGVVVATGQLQNAFGRNSIVYLDKGRDQGLLPGSMLELVRFRNVPDPGVSTDIPSLFFEVFKVRTLTELYEKVTRESMVYEKMVGRMIVLDAGPQTATALVLSTNENLQVGAFFRGASTWLDSPGAPPMPLSCTARP